MKKGGRRKSAALRVAPSAESGGFEPPVQLIPYVSLANWWFQPLTQLSGRPLRRVCAKRVCKYRIFLGNYKNSKPKFLFFASFSPVASEIGRRAARMSDLPDGGGFRSQFAADGEPVPEKTDARLPAPRKRGSRGRGPLRCFDENFVFSDKKSKSLRGDHSTFVYPKKDSTKLLDL